MSACKDCLIINHCMTHGMLGLAPDKCESQVPRNGALEIYKEKKLKEREYVSTKK